MDFFLGEKLYKIVSHLQDVSYIIPVPLHKEKQKLRGYNQSVLLAKGLNKHLKCQILTNVLLRGKNSDSQTHKSRYKRFENMENIFFVTNKSILKNKHIILLDDVFTTGATISECIKTLRQLKNVRISVVCLAS